MNVVPGWRGHRLAGRLLAAIGLWVGAGCADWTGEVEFAPAVPSSISIPRSIPERPEVGPWFVDRARDYGVDVVTRCGSPDKPSVLHSLGTGVALFDHDNDGDLDLFVGAGSEVVAGAVRPAGGPWLFRNDGPGRWADVTARSGLAWTGWAQGVAVADYDADGDLDLFIAHHGRDALWQNQGDGTFRDVARRAGLDDDLWGVAAAWGDVDGDGWLDLYVVNYLSVDPINPPPLHDHIGGVKVFQGPGMLPGQADTLWRNRGDGTFEDATNRAGLWRPEGKGMSAAFADLDGDGRLDLYVPNDGQANHLFRNLGKGAFHEAGLEAGAALDRLGAPEGSMGVEVGDVDRDGRLDLVYTNFRHEGTRLLLSTLNDGHFGYLDVSISTRLKYLTEPYVGWGLALADFDADGWLDIFQADGHVYPNTPDSHYDQPPMFLRNRGGASLEFEDVSSAWGPDLDAMRSGRGVAVGDVDGDGDLDLVMTTMDGPLRFLVNEGNRTHGVAMVRLVGKHPNTEAIGATVELWSGGARRMGVARRGGGFMAASDSALHFGLGTRATIDRIVARWPDGSTSEHADLPANALLQPREGEREVRVQPLESSGPSPGRKP